MPLSRERRNNLLRYLDKEFDSWNAIHVKYAPKNGIPVGGGDWQDSFFRMETIRGCTSSLQKGSTITEAVESGIAAGTLAIEKWNSRREYQVHRWTGMPKSYLETLIRHWKKVGS